MPFDCESCGSRAHSHGAREPKGARLEGLYYNTRTYVCPKCKNSFLTVELRTDAALVPSADKIGFRPLALALLVAELFGLGRVSPSLRRRLAFSSSSITTGESFAVQKGFSLKSTRGAAQRSSKSTSHESEASS